MTWHEDIHVRDDIVDEGARAGRDCLRGEEKWLESTYIRLRSACAKALLYIEQTVQLLDDLPLLIAQKEASKMQPAVLRLVEARILA